VIDYPPALLKEMFLFGIGFRNVGQTRSCLQIKRRRIAEFIVDDETLIKIGSIELVWL